MQIKLHRVSFFETRSCTGCQRRERESQGPELMIIGPANKVSAHCCLRRCYLFEQQQQPPQVRQHFFESHSSNPSQTLCCCCCCINISPRFVVAQVSGSCAGAFSCAQLAQTITWPGAPILQPHCCLSRLEWSAYVTCGCVKLEQLLKHLRLARWLSGSSAQWLSGGGSGS